MAKLSQKGEDVEWNIALEVGSFYRVLVPQSSEPPGQDRPRQACHRQTTRIHVRSGSVEITRMITDTQGNRSARKAIYTDFQEQCNLFILRARILFDFINYPASTRSTNRKHIQNSGTRSLIGIAAPSSNPGKLFVLQILYSFVFNTRLPLSKINSLSVHPSSN